MPSPRTKLVLDEQSFQGLLAAAFTIQQHNDRHGTAGSSSTVGGNQAGPKPAELCRHCGAPLPTGRTPCPTCGDENLRSGEHLQHLWASMWQLSQERGLGPQARKNAAPDASPLPSDPDRNGHDPADSRAPALSPLAKSELAEPQPTREATRQPAGDLVPRTPSIDNDLPQHTELDLSPAETPSPGRGREDSELAVSSSALSGGDPPGDDPPGDDLANEDSAAAETIPGPLRGLSDLWGRLHSHRANLYLGIAVLVAAVALLWPTATPQQPSLNAWERMLIAIGIAEAAPPVVHPQGDPNVKVWVDTHSALYYCPGEELYGKSPDGHFSTQREAQSDRFEPAERSVCVE
jgi:ribosomal protein L40E